MLTDNIFKENGKRLYFSDHNNYVKLRPNKTFLGFLPLSLIFYNISNLDLELVFNEFYTNIPDALSKKQKNKKLDNLLIQNNLNRYLGKNLWWDKFLFKNSSKPSLIDRDLAQASSEAIEADYFSKGFFNAKTRYRLDLKGKKGKIIYETQTGKPYILGDIQCYFKEKELEKIYLRYKKYGKIKTGKIYNTQDFKNELERIKNLYENYGYYNFNYLNNEIKFKIYLTAKEQKVKTLMIVNEKTPPKKGGNSLKTFKHIPYHFDQIKITVQNEIHKALNPFNYKGYIMCLPNTLKYKPSVFTDALVIKPKGLYRLQDIILTKDNINRFNNFNISIFSLKESKKSTEKHPLLDANIELVPNNKYELQLSFYCNYLYLNNLGISSGITLLTRNIFSGAENLELSIKVNVASVKETLTKTEGYFNAWETETQAKFDFPRFIFPLDIYFIKNKFYIPHSYVFLKIIHQKNRSIRRINLSGNIEYEWKNSIYQSHRFSILNIQFIQDLEKDHYYDFHNNGEAIKDSYDLEMGDRYLNNQTDIYFNRTLDQEKRIANKYFIHSVNYYYEYKNDINKYNLNPIFFYGRIELALDLLSWVNNPLILTQIKTTKQPMHSLFKLSCSQFLKFDLELRKYWKFSSTKTLASRIFLGIGIPYGNSHELPFDRSYSAGGYNDIRAWHTYELGPGDAIHYNSMDPALSDIKITINTEYRFDIFSKIYGAFFIDIGNIWSLKRKDNAINSTKMNSGMFEWSSFYKQMALGIGLGLRYNLELIIIRLDFAYKLHDPSKIYNRWLFSKLDLLNPIVNFAIGYPF